MSNPTEQERENLVVKSGESENRKVKDGKRDPKVWDWMLVTISELAVECREDPCDIFQGAEGLTEGKGK